MVQMMMVQMILKILKKKYANLLLKYFQLRKTINETKYDTSKELKDELDKIKDELDKTKDGFDDYGSFDDGSDDDGLDDVGSDNVKNI